MINKKKIKQQIEKLSQIKTILLEQKEENVAEFEDVSKRTMKVCMNNMCLDDAIEFIDNAIDNLVDIII